MTGHCLPSLFGCELQPRHFKAGCNRSCGKGSTGHLSTSKTSHSREQWAVERLVASVKGVMHMLQRYPDLRPHDGTSISCHRPNADYAYNLHRDARAALS